MSKPSPKLSAYGEGTRPAPAGPPRARAPPCAPPSHCRRGLMSKPSSKLSAYGERTRLVHAGRDPFEQHGFVNTPIYRGSTVLYPTTDDLLNRRGRYVYGTKGTPTTEALEQAWTALSGRGRPPLRARG